MSRTVELMRQLPSSCPAIQPALTSGAAQARPTGGMPRAQPEASQGSHGQAATGRCWPQPRMDSDAGDYQEFLLKSLCASSVRSVSSVVKSLVVRQ